MGMKKKIIKKGIIYIVVFALLLFISWLLMCGIIKLITLCFGLSFSWLIATGIWLIVIIAKSVFGKD